MVQKDGQPFESGSFWEKVDQANCCNETPVMQIKLILGNAENGTNLKLIATCRGGNFELKCGIIAKKVPILVIT